MSVYGTLNDKQKEVVLHWSLPVPVQERHAC